jgi:hypothetical protein
MKSVITACLLLSGLAQAVRPIPKHDDISGLLEGNRQLLSLKEVQRRELLQGSTALSLWSGSYWPHFQGSLAVRYRDPLFIELIEQKAQWNKFKELADKTPTHTYTGQEKLLSPAEKYDLLVGDHEMTLTKYSWELGEKTQNAGMVPIWRGLCDGWAAASQMMPRPTRAVTLHNPAGAPVVFFPEDIKALGSLLYARTQQNVTFIGKRCRNAVVGLFTNTCDGTNPAAFHNALINRVGMMQKTFIADVSPGSEVWNYPVKDYKISFYNVFSDQEAPRFEDVLESFDKKKKFRKRNDRHPETAYIVGVKTIVNYIDMRPANLLGTDGPENDQLLQKEYWYDLELDHRYQVVGGEWAGNVKPDFIWAPNDGKYPLSWEEATNGKPRSQAELTRKARIASKRGHPLSVVVEELFEKAR